MLGKKKEDEPQDDDVILFDVGNQEEPPVGNPEANKNGAQSFTVQAEQTGNQSSKAVPTAPPKVVEASMGEHEDDEGSKSQSQSGAAMDQQLSELSDNIKNLLYDFRSFMGESGSPFNPNEIPAEEPRLREVEPMARAVTVEREPKETGRRTPGYISAQTYDASDKEGLEDPSDVRSRFAERYLRNKGLDVSKPDVDKPALKEAFKAALGGTRFSAGLRSDLDGSDMPALIRAINSTDYLLNAVGRKNLLRVLEIGTREGWLRPEVERLVLSVAEILSSSGNQIEERNITVSDLLRVIYFLNRLLDPEISEFLSLSSIQDKNYMASCNPQR